MSKFRIIEIVNADTMRVSPKWRFNDESGEFSNDRVKILGLAALVGDNPSDKNYFKSVLTAILEGKVVELVNPALTKDNVDGQPEVTCEVIIEGTDLMFYFTGKHELA